MITPPTDSQHIIRLGPACVLLIEASGVLLAGRLDQADMIDLQAAREVAQRKLRELVANAGPAVTAEIMVGSEKVVLSFE
jgi:hypothetical protein